MEKLAVLYYIWVSIIILLLIGSGIAIGVFGLKALFWILAIIGGITVVSFLMRVIIPS